MNAPRLFRRAALTAAALVVLGAARAAAQDSVVVRFGGELAGTAGSMVEVPVVADLRAAGGRPLGSYRAEMRFDPALLWLDEVLPGTFAPPLVNSDSAWAGVLRFAAALPAGAEGEVTLFVLRFFVQTDTTLSSALTMSFDEMSAAGTFEDILPLVRVVNGLFCRASGRWGDADLDGQANSRDALVALSWVVGLAGGVDTTLIKPWMADVDADGAVTSRDALIILSFAVGLPVDGFRVGHLAAGTCSAGIGITLAISPDTLELQTGQYAQVVLSARDASGRPLSTRDVAWSAAHPAVAGWDPNEGAIVGRDAGVTTLTARLGTTVSASITVVVVERRRHWYADVQEALGATTQTGSTRHPFAFIGQALEFAHDGDTIHVAPGTYEEQIGAWLSVAILGDPADRPIIDPRGSPYYSDGMTAVSLGNASAPVILEDIRMLGGGVYVEALGLTARRLSIQSPESYRALAFRGPEASGGGAPPGVMGASAAPPRGNVLVDSVDVAGYDEFGIDLRGADTVTVRHSRVDRLAPAGGVYCYGASPGYAGGIHLEDLSVGEVHDNVVTDAPCLGIVAGAVSVRLAIERNRVVRATSAGISVSAPVVHTGHNVVREVGGDSAQSATYGIFVPAYFAVAVDSVRSLGDSVAVVRSAEYYYDSYGFAVDTARTAVVESLAVDSVGLDGGYSGAGVSFRGRRLWVGHSRISDILAGNGIQATGGQLAATTRRNLVTRTSSVGIIMDEFLGGEAPPSRTPALGAAASSFPLDTIVIVGDVVRSVGYHGVSVTGGSRVVIDSALVDSALTHGVNLYHTGRVTVANSVLQNSWDASGIDASSVAGIELIGDTLRANGTGLAYGNGLDSAIVLRSAFIGNQWSGAVFSGGLGSARVDSTVFSGNGVAVPYGSGLAADYGVGLTARWVRFEGNRAGVELGTYPGSSSVRHSNFLGNAVGASNLAIDTTVLRADSNYWGDPNGPRCDSLYTPGCSGLSVSGDTIWGNVIIAPYLGGPAPTPAPRLLPAAPRPLTAAASPATSAREERRRAVTWPRTSTPVARPAPRATPRWTWRRGGEAREAQPRPSS